VHVQFTEIYSHNVIGNMQASFGSNSFYIS
jgi:hypothetical protein